MKNAVNIEYITNACLVVFFTSFLLTILSLISAYIKKKYGNTAITLLAAILCMFIYSNKIQIHSKMI